MNSRGFTLVEVMVVLVILGLTATFATMGFQRLEDDRLTKQVGHLSAWLQSVSDDAVLDSVVYGVWLSRDGRRLESVFYRDYRWWPLAAEQASSEELQEGVVITLEMDQRWQQLKQVEEDEAERVPDLVFLPTGLSLPGKLRLQDGDKRIAEIERDENGLFAWSLAQ